MKRNIGAGLSQRLFLGVLGWLLVAFSYTSIYGRTSATDRVGMRARLSALYRSMAFTRKQLRQTKQEEQEALEALEQIRDRIQTTESRIRLVRHRLEQTYQEIQAIQEEIARSEQRLKEQYELLAHRIVILDRHGEVDFLSVLLGATDYWDFLDRRRFVNEVLKGDIIIVQSILTEKARIEQQRQRLEQAKKEQEELSRELDQRWSELRDQAMEQRQLLQEIEAERRRLERELEEKERASEQVRRFLEHLATTPEGRQRALQPFSGHLALPVNGPITSGFGPRFHPLLKRFKLHTGVDIAAPIGTPVYAAAEGVVVHAGWLGAYGNAVIIDHGGGVSTLYGHLSSINVSPGQTVAQGELIGGIGSTGLSTGPHLHFEKRFRGTPINPF